ncbi:MAG: cytochrome c maturation protein CcmE [Gammaproteobacteria bacterium]|nr:cytochrome c maturation protein CcmE [Gammaproteobacteria bacterium]
MTRRQRRTAAVVVLVAGVAAATALAVTAFRKNMMYFYTPSDLAARDVPVSAVMDLGGLVEPGTLKHGTGLAIRFMMTDCHHQMPVAYDGVLPDLFREGQGVVATGHLNADGTFVASRILAKHDSSYMPPNVARQVKAAELQGRKDCAAFKTLGDKAMTAARDAP